MRIPDRRRDRRDARAQDPENLKCDFFQIATFVITVARDCAWEGGDEGVDDPAEVARVSAQMDADAERVTNYLSTLMAETELLARSSGYKSPEQLQPNDVLMHVEPGHWLHAAEVITSD